MKLILRFRKVVISDSDGDQDDGIITEYNIIHDGNSDNMFVMLSESLRIITIRMAIEWFLENKETDDSYYTLNDTNNFIEFVNASEADIAMMKLLWFTENSNVNFGQ